MFALAVHAVTFNYEIHLQCWPFRAFGVTRLCVNQLTFACLRRFFFFVLKNPHSCKYFLNRGIHFVHIRAFLKNDKRTAWMLAQWKESNNIGTRRIKSKDLCLHSSSYLLVTAATLNSLVCVLPDAFCFLKTHLLCTYYYMANISQYLCCLSYIILMSAVEFHHKDSLHICSVCSLLKDIRLLPCFLLLQTFKKW